MTAFLGFQIKHLGDVLMTLPAMGLIKKNQPDISLSLVVSPAAAPLVINHPWLDEIIVHDFKPKSLSVSPALKLAGKFRERGFEASFHFDGQIRSGILACLAGIKERLVPEALFGQLNWPWLYKNRVSGVKSPPESLALSYQRLVASFLGFTPDSSIRAVPPRIDETDGKIKELLGKIPKGQGPLVGLCLKGRQWEKSWPLKYFAEVVRELERQKGARFFVVGGRDESPLCRILSEISETALVDFCGETTLLELVSLLSRASLFITIDTGPAHLCALTETPLITIFTATNPVQWGALSSSGHILCYDWALKRFGLESKGIFTKAFEITPALVVNSALEFLAKA